MRVDFQTDFYAAVFGSSLKERNKNGVFLNVGGFDLYVQGRWGPKGERSEVRKKGDIKKRILIS